MEKISGVFVTVMLVSLVTPTKAQFVQSILPPEQMTGGYITAGGGISVIDDDFYYLFNLRPEFASGSLNYGLDLNLRFDTRGSFYRDDIQDAYDILRMINYVRLNQPTDRFYAKAGILDYVSFGYGSVIYRYLNSPSYEDRKIGLDVTMDFDRFGYRAIIGDIGFQQGGGVAGFRGYIRPFPFFNIPVIPKLSRLEVGATYAADLHDYAGIVSQEPQPENTERWNNRNDKGVIQIIGFDAGIPWLSMPVVRSTFYFDYANILGFGHGGAVGIDTRIFGPAFVKIFTKFEYRLSSDRFIHSYFNTTYEIERYRSNFPDWSSRANMLDNVVSPGPAYFGEMTVSVMDFVNITGNYQRLRDDPDSGRLFLRLTTGELMPMVYTDIGYDKRHISDESGVFTFDENTLMFANIGFRPYPFLLISVLYQWTWTPETDPVTGDRSYDTQERIEPKISLIFTF